MNLGIVGHAQEKFTPETEWLARDAIRQKVLEYRPAFIVSGRSPMGGVDIYAEDVARELGVPTLIYPPRIRQWLGPGGFRERNLLIARASDKVLVVVVRKYPSNYQGRIFPYCYHCSNAGVDLGRGHGKEHVKSGGCWTAWQAPEREWVII